MTLDPLVSALLADGVLHCPSCRLPLSASANGLGCGSCRAVYAVRSGVPDLVAQYVPQQAAIEVDKAFVSQVMSKLGIPDRPDTRKDAEDALRDTALTLPEASLTAEIADLADRLGLSAPRSRWMARWRRALRRILGLQTAETGAARTNAATTTTSAPTTSAPTTSAPTSSTPTTSATTTSATTPPETASKDARPERPPVRFVRHFLGSVLPRDCLIHRSFRIENVGARTLDASGSNMTHLDARWYAADGSELSALRTEARLPVDLAPQRSLSVIVPLRTPAVAARYRIDVLLGSSTSGASESLCSAEVAVGSTSPLPSEIACTSHGFNYTEDHHEANVLLRDFLLDHYPDRRLRLLEIGGGIHPQLTNMIWMGHRVVATDISAAMGRLGRLVYRHQAQPNPIDQGSLAFFACDANALPFADHSFDVVGFFAAFHHFADPVQLLRDLARLLTPKGFVALMCEPCAPELADDAYLRDLRKGINEQSFAPDEYLEIIARAGYRILKGRIDGGSLKLLVTPIAQP